MWTLDLIFDLLFTPSVGNDNWIVDFGLTFAGGRKELLQTLKLCLKSNLMDVL